jgi:4-amino-4-deoxy-L-arabinose transferase-like glycosyltransferase
LRNQRIFLLLWIVIPLIFFSASHSKLAPYIFPIFPPLAIVLGHYLAECWDGRIATRALRINSLIVAALFAAVILTYYFIPLPISPDDKLDFATGVTAPMLIPVVIVLAGLVYVGFSKRAAPVLIGMLTACAVILDISANYIVAAVDRANVKPLAAMVKERLHEGDTVAAYGSYFQDLPVYLGRNIVVADYTGELDFGVTHYPETHGWMLTADEFWQRCAKDDHPLYVFMKNTVYDGTKIPPNCRLRVLAKYGKTVLLEKDN